MDNSKVNIIDSAPKTYQGYLDAIYRIARTKKGGWVSNKDIANEIKVEPSSVSYILHKLNDLELIIWKPKRSLRLTQKGKDIARYLNETQYLLEFFFEKVLKIHNKEMITKISYEIKHYITVEVKESLESFLISSGYITK
ncbi:MAG: metal-dependent transcriptional regulator [Candidatus Odinarchaeota archaeon]